MKDLFIFVFSILMWVRFDGVVGGKGSCVCFGFVVGFRFFGVRIVGVGVGIVVVIFGIFFGVVVFR